MLLPCEMEDATVTKTKVDVTEATPICKGVKAERIHKKKVEET